MAKMYVQINKYKINRIIFNQKAKANQLFKMKTIIFKIKVKNQSRTTILH